LQYIIGNVFSIASQWYMACLNLESFFSKHGWIKFWICEGTSQLKHHWLETQETQRGRELYNITDHMDLKTFIRGQKMGSNI
jgi:hypothetical protein